MDEEWAQVQHKILQAYVPCGSTYYYAKELQCLWQYLLPTHHY